MPKNGRLAALISRTTVLLVAISVAFGAQTASGLAASSSSNALDVAHASKQATSTVKARAAQGVPTEGIFDSCNLASALSTCEQDLLQMHQAGFQVAVLSIANVPLDNISGFASYAQSIGMSVMWEIDDPGFWGGAWELNSAVSDWPGFSTACDCTDTGQVLSTMIQWLSALPATYGYYAADDWTLTRNNLPGLTQYVSEIKAADPNHMVMVGSTQPDGGTYYSSDATIGNEIYPETTTSLLPRGANLAAWESIDQSITQDQHDANNAGTASAFILQAFTFGDSVADGEAVGVCTPSMSETRCASLLQYPNAAVQIALRDEVLERAHPKLILWYTFSEASQGKRWSALSSVIRAPYPATASAARARLSRRAASRKRHAQRRRTQLRRAERRRAERRRAERRAALRRAERRRRAAHERA